MIFKTGYLRHYFTVKHFFQPLFTTGMANTGRAGNKYVAREAFGILPVFDPVVRTHMHKMQFARTLLL